MAVYKIHKYGKNGFAIQNSGYVSLCPSRCGDIAYVCSQLAKTKLLPEESINPAESVIRLENTATVDYIGTFLHRIYIIRRGGTNIAYLEPISSRKDVPAAAPYTPFYVEQSFGYQLTKQIYGTNTFLYPDNTTYHWPRR
jgi:hypothetical protein